MNRGGGAGGMGLDRGSRGGGAGGQGNFRRDHQTNGHRNYGPSEYGNYMDHSRDGHHGSGDASSMKYEHARQNGNSHGAKHELGGQAPANGGYSGSGANNGTGRNGRGNSGNHGISGGECNLTQAEIASLESKIANIHTDMNTAVSEITAKENEKFDLIFSILIELQKRQAQLEDSVRSLKVQLGAQGTSGPAATATPNGTSQNGASPQGQGQQSMQFGNGVGLPTPATAPFTPTNGQMASNQMGNQMNGQGSSAGAQMNSQGNSQMNGPMPGQMFINGGQMPMGGQQYGNMVAADGSQAFFTNMTNVVLVASPTNMQQMPYGVPQMMSPQGAISNLPAMPQQVAVQYVNQGQEQQPSDTGFQWSGNNEASATNMQDTANGASATGQPSDYKEGEEPGQAQDQDAIGKEDQKVEPRIEEE